MGRAFGLLVGVLALCNGVSQAVAAEFMAPYRAQCGVDLIYADCVDQRPILTSALAKAKAEGKRLVVIFGFNTCGPCNALDAWLKLPDGERLMGKYVQAEISIFTPADHGLRTEVFDTMLPPLKLHINRQSPYGVPLMAIIDPKTNSVVGAPILGFNPDHAELIAYLSGG